MYTPQKAFEELSKFRSLMKCSVSEEKAKYIWGKNFVKSLNTKLVNEKVGNIIPNKLDIAKQDIKYLKVGSLVKFIGVSGSVAAGFAGDDDDIDIFVVVKNNSAWIYRAVLAVKNIFHHRIRTKRDGENVKDKFCLNLICEERDIVFDNDMFNFHELMYLIPIYNERYLNYIYSQNSWLKDEYGVKNDLMINRVTVSKRKNIFWSIVNFLAFFLQLVFMIVTKHSPEIPRLKENFKRGRIEFFPSDYKTKKMNNFLKTV